MISLRKSSNLIQTRVRYTSGWRTLDTAEIRHAAKMIPKNVRAGNYMTLEESIERFAREYGYTDFAGRTFGY